MNSKNLPEVFEARIPKVYKNKKLNNANFGNFTLNDYQVFLHLVSKIGGVDESGKYLQPEQLQREYILAAKEFSEMFSADLSNSYKFLCNACKKLMKTSIILEKPELSGSREINVCSMAEYNESKGSITIEFTDRIMPYLAQVKEKFVLYNLKELSNFGSLYTTRLYELIQEFKETGWMLKSLDQLRAAFAVGDKFKMYGHFKKKILSHACQEINDNYDMGLKFEEIKKGRKVVAVKFSFESVVISQVTNQRTGKTTNIYSKPKPQSKLRKKITNNSGQLSFDNVKQEAKPLKGILATLLSKISLKK